ncbi:Ran GAP Rna1 [Saitoella coloradoensis]
MSIFTLEGRVLKLDSRADIEPHIKDLLDYADVEEVRLNGNTFGIEASEALAEALKDKKKLKVVQFADIFTGRLREEIPPALSAMLTALLTCPNLHTVNLSDNAFGPTAQAPLMHFFSKHTPLEHLYLANNGMGPQAGSLIANALTELAAAKKAAGPDTPTLKTIVCGRNRLENGSMESWAKCFAAHGSFEEIRMYQNGIRPEGIEHVFTQGLSKCPGLKHVDFQDNTFTLKGAQALAKVIGGWSSLKELNFNDCLLSERGAHALAKALRENKNEKLEILRLQFNEIKNTGVKELLTAIKLSLPELEKLELNGNTLSEEDPIIEEIQSFFEERGKGELDELDELEEPDSDEEEEEDDEGEEEDEDEDKEDVVKDADEEEEKNVAPEQDKSVDDLADALASKATV